MSGSEILFVAVIMSDISCFEMSLKQSWTFRQSCELTFLNPKGILSDPSHCTTARRWNALHFMRAHVVIVHVVCWPAACLHTLRSCRQTKVDVNNQRSHITRMYEGTIVCGSYCRYVLPAIS